jgi:lipopolysaccharide biosynthesis glycosyltransferase
MPVTDRAFAVRAGVWEEDLSTTKASTYTTDIRRHFDQPITDRAFAVQAGVWEDLDTTYTFEKPYDLSLCSRYWESNDGRYHDTLMYSSDKSFKSTSPTPSRMELNFQDDYTTGMMKLEVDMQTKCGMTGVNILQIKRRLLDGDSSYNGDSTMSAQLRIYNDQVHFIRTLIYDNDNAICERMHHVVMTHSVEAKEIKVWIDGALVFTRQDTNTQAYEYYFKAGVYLNDNDQWSSHNEAWFKDFKVSRCSTGSCEYVPPV